MISQNPSGITKSRFIECIALLIMVLLFGIASGDSHAATGKHQKANPPASTEKARALPRHDAVSSIDRAPGAPSIEKFGRLPLRFERNDGQADADARFLTHGPGYTLFLTPGDIRFNINRRSMPTGGSQKQENPLSLENLLAAPSGLSILPTENNGTAPQFPDRFPLLKGSTKSPFAPPSLSRQEDFHAPADQHDVIRLQLLGASTRADVTGVDELPGKSNYYVGTDPRQWRTGIPNYADVRYHGVYPGIDLDYYGNQSGQLEYDFLVAPGADASAIKFVVDLAESNAPTSLLRIDPSGDLIIPLASGDLRFRKPVVYQEKASVGTNDLIDAPHRRSSIERREYLAGRYVLDAENRVHFALGAYDHTRPLVIDPALVFSTYVGFNNQGATGGAAVGVGVDAANNVYVAGGESASGSLGFYVNGINSQGSAFLFATYVGVASGARAMANAMAVDSAGNTYVTGSSGAGLPATSGAAYPTCTGSCASPFVVKVSPTGTLIYATYTGAGSANGAAIAVDNSGAAYITGSVNSLDLPIVNAFQTAYQPAGNNAFVQKLDPTGSTLVYSTYLHGSGANGTYDFSGGYGIAVDSAGSAYVVGSTLSTSFPMVNALEPALPQFFSGPFLTKFSPGGNSLMYSTYLAGTGNGGDGLLGDPADYALGVAVDSAGDAYVTGVTASTDFPFTMNAYRVSCTEAAVQACQSPGIFALEVSPDGSTLLYSTFLGSGSPAGIALDPAGNPWIAGTTKSSHFPALQAVQSTYQEEDYGYLGLDIGDTPNAFAIHLGPDGIPSFSTYLSSGIDGAEGHGIAVDRGGNAWVTGMAANTDDFPFVNPLRTGVPTEGFLSEISLSETGPVLSVASLNLPMASVRNVGGQNLNFTSITAGNGITLLGDDCGSSLAPGGICHVVMGVPQGSFSTGGTLTIASNAPNSPQSFTISTQVINPVINNLLVVTPDHLEFPAQLVGTTSQPQTMTVTNLDFPNAVNITQVGLSPGDQSVITATDFVETNTCPASLPAGQSCVITVQYQPTPGAAGVETGGIQFTNSYDFNKPTFPVSGVRSNSALVSSGGNYQLGYYESGTIQFGTLYVGTTSLARVISLTNTSTQAVTVAGVTANGPYAQTNNCVAAIAPGMSCRVSIAFSPTSAGSAPGTISVANSGQGSPVVINLAGAGTTGLSASPTSVNISYVQVGTTASQVVTLSYVGPGTLQFSPFVATSDFSETDTCSGGLASGASCAVTVNFSPSVVGVETGTLTIPFSTPGSPLVIPLWGLGSSTVYISPGTLGFYPQQVGTTSSAQALSVENGGTTPVTISSVAVSGDFAISSNTCPMSPATLAANATCVLDVTFTPTADGDKNGTLTLMASDTSAPHVVPLGGEGVSTPVVTFNPGAAYFNQQAIGTSSAPMPVTLSNIGSVALTITSIVPTGDFSETNNCGSTVAAGASCTINVTFTPTGGSARNGGIIITDNAPDSPQTLVASGTGEGSAVSVAPPSLTFAPILVKTTSGPQTVSLTNTGNAALTVTSVTASTGFAATNGCSGTVPIGGYCTVNVTFSPTTGGTNSGTLTFTDSAATSPQTVSLTGVGEDFSMAVATGSSSSASVSPGQIANYPLNLTGLGGLNQPINFTCTGAPTEATCTVNPVSATPSASGTVAVTVSVSTTASSGAAFRVWPKPPVNSFPRGWPMIAGLLLILVLLLAALRREARISVRTVARAAFVAAVVAALLALAACGGGGGGGGGGGAPSNPGTPAGAYTLTVTGTAGSAPSAVSHSVTLTLNVS